MSREITSKGRVVIMDGGVGVGQVSGLRDAKRLPASYLGGKQCSWW